MFASLALYSLYFNLSEFVILQNVKKIIQNNTEILFWYTNMEINTRISKFIMEF